MLPRRTRVSFIAGLQVAYRAERRLRKSFAGSPCRPLCLRVEQLEPRILLAIDPTGLEQEMLQLVNRFRTDPQGELTRLVDRLNPISSPERYIEQELEYWGVSGSALARQWTGLAAVPPLAWSEALFASAHVHNAAMIRNDDQQHQFPGQADPGERMREAGYNWRRWGENIYAYPRSNLEAHGGFVIDWGAGPYGIQDPPGHRDRLLNASFQHIGIAITNVGDDSSSKVGPLVVTQDLGQPMVAGDAYVVGAVFEQIDGSPWYRSGSGYGQVTLTFEGTGGTFQVTSMSAGGYQVQLPPGTYRGFATGETLPTMLVSDEFVIDRSNVALDFQYPRDEATPPPIAHRDIVATHLATGIVIDVVANDEVAGAMIDAGSVVILTSPSHGRLAPWNDKPGTYSYEPAEGFRGIDAFEYQVMDSNGMVSNAATATVLVLDFLDHPWHNPWTPADVNGDDIVSPVDVLLVIDNLNTAGARRLAVPPAGGMVPPLLDVSGDDSVSPRDVLLIISQLNDAVLGEAEGEGLFRSPVGSSSGESSRVFVDAALATTIGSAAAARHGRAASSFAQGALVGFPQDAPPIVPRRLVPATRHQVAEGDARDELFAAWPPPWEDGWP